MKVFLTVLKWENVKNGNAKQMVELLLIIHFILAYFIIFTQLVDNFL